MAVVGVLGGGLALCLQPPALAAAPGTSGSAGCQTLQLSMTQLCVSVQSTSASIRSGGTAGYLVTVWVQNGSALGVSVDLSGTGGTASYSSGCPSGNGAAHCWMASLNFFGSASSVGMQVSVPAATSATAVTLDATASVAQLPGWTPPSAGATVAIATPQAARPKPVQARPAPGSSHSSPAPHPSSSRSPGGSRTPGSTGASTGTGSGHGTSTGTGSGHGTGTGTGTGNGTGSGGTRSGSGSIGAGQDVGATGPVPLPLDTAPGVLATVGARNASGLFPQIAPSGSARLAPQADVASTPIGGFPMVTVAIIVGIVAVLAWAAMAAHPRLRRR